MDGSLSTLPSMSWPGSRPGFRPVAHADRPASAFPVRNRPALSLHRGARVRRRGRRLRVRQHQHLALATGRPRALDRRRARRRIVAVELYKRIAGITVRTGARFALPLAVGVAVGRIGCFFAGLDDFTHGTPTALPWGDDFGDGMPRHPVQLYESAAMAAFAAVYVLARVARRSVRDRATDSISRRLLWRAAFCLGILQALRHAHRPVHTISSPVGRDRSLYAVVMIATAPTNPRSHR